MHFVSIEMIYLQSSLCTLEPKIFMLFYEYKDALSILSFLRISFSSFNFRPHHCVENNFLYRMSYISKKKFDEKSMLYKGNNESVQMIFLHEKSKNLLKCTKDLFLRNKNFYLCYKPEIRG